jgi:hypothetical protein
MRAHHMPRHESWGGGALSGFEMLFGVPDGHLLRLVRTVPRCAGGEVREREHEEYDRNGRLIAVYESWAREGGGLAFVKYSPFGWVLSISGRSPRHPPQKARLRRVDTVSP